METNTRGEERKMRNQRVNIRLNNEQKRFIETEAKHNGVTNSHLLLACFKKQYPRFPYDVRRETERVRKFKQARRR